MGTCLSKKGSSSSSSVAALAAQTPAAAKPGAARVPGSPAPKKVSAQQPKQQPAGTAEDESFVKKEVFVIKHRRSHDRAAAPGTTPDADEKIGPKSDGPSKDASEASGNNVGAVALAVGAGIRTSSCTKEEVESILIQCGRLSHSGSGSSSGKPAGASSCPTSGGRSRRYSGSKRSYDFDHSNENEGRIQVADAALCNEEEATGEVRRHRQVSRHSSGSHGSRRRTPSRERDQQRSGSTERRRVSRSPGRRSEITSAPAAPAAGASDKPGKLVSVPATVPLVEQPAHATSSVKRISVKRNAGEGGRSAPSPRSQSPARAKDGPQQVPPLVLSRNSSRKTDHSPYRRKTSGDPDPSRKTEQSPYRRNPSGDADPSRKHEQSPCRRNPLSEIDHNSSSAPALPSAKVAPPISSRVQTRNNKENEGLDDDINTIQVSVIKSNVDTNNWKAIQGTFKKVNNSKETEKLEAAVAEAENQNPQKLTRSRSARRSSGHIEFNPETPSNPTSYTNLLLEDIQNFHQTNPASFSLPACVAKAQSIFQAVADLNSNTASNMSSQLDDKRVQPQPSFQFSSNCIKDPFVESEVGAGDDLMEPSLHKYVTVKRGSSSTTSRGGDRDELESSGSNSFMGGSGTTQNQWEPGSVDSSECWTSSSAFRAGFPNSYTPEVDDAKRNTGGKRRDGAAEQNGIGSGRVRCR